MMRTSSVGKKLLHACVMPAEMYSVKPFYDSRQEVELPDVMYKVKNVHETSREGKTQCNRSNSIDPLVELEQRQNAIFTRLASLKQTLNELTARYDVPKSTSSQGLKGQSGDSNTQKLISKNTSFTAGSPLGNGIHGVVICADPENPPLSLFVLFERLKQQFKVLATSYIHSSVTNVDSKLCDMIKSGSQVVRGEHQIALSVVWKKVENGPQLMISPTKQSVVTGEVNVARYINRLLSPGFDTDDVVMATTADEWLDTADIQIFNGNSKQKTAALKSLNVRLKKNGWIVGSDFSFVDIVMWSALNQSDLANGAPENVQKWLKACANIPFFRTALSLL